MATLEGRCALVTGGASGIGLATVRRLAAEGARVTVIDVDAETGEPIATEVDGAFVRADVSDPEQVAEAFGRAGAAMGKIDIAHLNAGVTTGESDITKLTDAQLRRICSINIDGVVFGVREAVRLMEATGGGAIVATASLSGLIAYPIDPIYAMTKHAVVGLVRGIAPQLEEKGITINAICPGIVETPLVGEEATRLLKEAGFPLISPEEIAEAVVTAVRSGGTAGCWVCQPGREALRYEFRGVPGPRVAGAEGKVPPQIRS